MLTFLKHNNNYKKYNLRFVVLHSTAASATNINKTEDMKALILEGRVVTKEKSRCWFC
jgi:hypothetical protein